MVEVRAEPVDLPGELLGVPTPASASAGVRRNSVQAMFIDSSSDPSGDDPGFQSVATAIGTLCLRKAATGATGTDMPGPREVVSSGDHAICWMSPDELLVLCPYDAVGKTLAKMHKALGETHALAVDVSDARAVFRVSGPHAREVLAKLAPVDLSTAAFGQDDFRRTRLAQVPAAFWMRDAETFEIICFRSVAQYVHDLLTTAAQTGSEVGFLT